MVMVSHCLSGGSFSLAEAVAGQGENLPSSCWSSSDLLPAGDARYISSCLGFSESNE